MSTHGHAYVAPQSVSFVPHSHKPRGVGSPLDVSTYRDARDHEQYQTTFVTLVGMAVAREAETVPKPVWLYCRSRFTPRHHASMRGLDGRDKSRTSIGEKVDRKMDSARAATLRRSYPEEEKRRPRPAIALSSSVCLVLFGHHPPLQLLLADRPSISKRAATYPSSPIPQIGGSNRRVLPRMQAAATRTPQEPTQAARSNSPTSPPPSRPTPPPTPPDRKPCALPSAAPTRHHLSDTQQRHPSQSRWP